MWWRISAFNGYQTSTMNFQTFSQVAFAFRVTPGLLVTGLLYALAMGLVGGLFPAIRAARLPIPTACGNLVSPSHPCTGSATTDIHGETLNPFMLKTLAFPHLLDRSGVGVSRLLRAVHVGSRGVVGGVALPAGDRAHAGLSPVLSRTARSR